jgi:hypothetical protein
MSKNINKNIENFIKIHYTNKNMLFLQVKNKGLL